MQGDKMYNVWTPPSPFQKTIFLTLQNILVTKIQISIVQLL